MSSDSVPVVGATTLNVSKTWRSQMKSVHNDHLYIPTISLTKSAPDYMDIMTYECHTRGIERADDYVMWMIYCSLSHITNGEMYADKMKHENPKFFTMPEPIYKNSNDIPPYRFIGYLDHYMEDDSRMRILAEWLHGDFHRYKYVDESLEYNHRKGEYMSQPLKLFDILQDSANTEFRVIYNIVKRHIQDYLKLVNREGH